MMNNTVATLANASSGVSVKAPVIDDPKNEPTEIQP